MTLTFSFFVQLVIAHVTGNVDVQLHCSILFLWKLSCGLTDYSLVYSASGGKGQTSRYLFKIDTRH